MQNKKLQDHSWHFTRLIPITCVRLCRTKLSQNWWKKSQHYVAFDHEDAWKADSHLYLERRNQVLKKFSCVQCIFVWEPNCPLISIFATQIYHWHIRILKITTHIFSQTPAVNTQAIEWINDQGNPVHLGRVNIKSPSPSHNFYCGTKMSHDMFSKVFCGPDEGPQLECESPKKIVIVTSSIYCNSNIFYLLHWNSNNLLSIASSSQLLPLSLALFIYLSGESCFRFQC